MSEPLSPGQLASIGWAHRQGSATAPASSTTTGSPATTGGYDAIYYYGSKIAAAKDQRSATFGRLAERFFQTFPQLEGERFSHKWGGVIDTCSRFCAFFGIAHQGRLPCAAGYTGLGVGASRFGARVPLDLLSAEATELEMVGTRPIPFPPEPLRSAGSSSPGGRWPRRTAAMEAATSGCACWTEWA